jgi:hypothetical protein
MLAAMTQGEIIVGDRVSYESPDRIGEGGPIGIVTALEFTPSGRAVLVTFDPAGADDPEGTAIWISVARLQRVEDR